MSKAIKCDRCGCCFDHEATEKDFTRIEHIYAHDGESYGDCRYKHVMDYCDLCPECTKQFKEFMEGKTLVDIHLLSELQKDYDHLREDYDDLCVELHNAREGYESLLEDEAIKRKAAEMDLECSRNRYNKLNRKFCDLLRKNAEYKSRIEDLEEFEKHQVNNIRQFKEEQLQVLHDIPAEDIKRFILEAVEQATFGGCREKRKTVDDWIGKRCCE